MHIHSFETPEVWQLKTTCKKKIYTLVKNFPIEGLYRLTTKIKRFARISGDGTETGTTFSTNLISK